MRNLYEDLQKQLITTKVNVVTVLIWAPVSHQPTLQLNSRIRRHVYDEVDAQLQEEARRRRFDP